MRSAKENIRMIECLMEFGSTNDIHVKDNYGKTPVMLAVENGHSKVKDWLKKEASKCVTKNLCSRARVDFVD